MLKDSIRSSGGGIPYGWAQKADAADVRQHAVRLFDVAMSEPIYDKNATAWDAVLKFLNLPLLYQPAIAKVLSEGLWRAANNPKAYVATAACREKVSKELRNFRYKEQVPPFVENPKAYLAKAGPEFRFDGSVGRSSEKGRHAHAFAPVEDHNHDEVISDRDGARESDDRVRKSFGSAASAGFVGGGRRGGPAGGVCGGQELLGRDCDAHEPQIPDWLQHKEEYDRPDWTLVAAHAALKPKMAPAVGLALTLKCRHELSRDEAMVLVSSFDLQSEVEAAYKWIERNEGTRIAPLFKMEKAPPSAPQPPIHSATTSWLSDRLSHVAISWNYDIYDRGDVEVTMRQSGTRGKVGFLACDRKDALETLSDMLADWHDGIDIFAPNYINGSPIHPPPGLTLLWGYDESSIKVTIREDATARETTMAADHQRELLEELVDFFEDWADDIDVFSPSY